VRLAWDNYLFAFKGALTRARPAGRPQRAWQGNPRGGPPRA